MDIEYYCQGTLNWPTGYARTPRHLRTWSAFGRSNPVVAPGARGAKVRMTVHSALMRLVGELMRFTRTGRDWRTTNIVITANVPTSARGGFRSDRQAQDDVGVALWFDLDGKEKVFACDKWDSVADNLTAIAKTLEALRGLERWGVSETDRAFTGFTALPAPGDATANTCWTALGLDPKASHTRDSISAQFRLLAKDLCAKGQGDSDEMRILTSAKHQALDSIQ